LPRPPTRLVVLPRRGRLSQLTVSEWPAFWQPVVGPEADQASGWGVRTTVANGGPSAVQCDRAVASASRVDLVPREPF
jgi:hypothetical protein